MQLKATLAHQHIWTLFLLTVRKTNQKWYCGGFMRRANPITVCSQHPNTSTARGYISRRAVPYNTTSCCTISTCTWWSHLMQLMWMDFSLYLCHLTCISLIPLFSISQSISAPSLLVSLCVYVHACVSGVEMECRLAPGCLLGSTPPTLLMQSANTYQPSPGKEEEREGKEMAHLHQSIPSSPSQLVSFYKHYRTVFLSTWVTIPIIRLWFSVIFCTNININIIFILKFDLYLYSAVFILY